VEDILRIFVVVNSDFINNKNLTFIKIGTCIVNKYQLYAKHYKVNALDFACNLQIKPKNQLFSDICLYEPFISVLM